MLYDLAQDEISDLEGAWFDPRVVISPHQILILCEFEQ